jgi:polyphosphate kinase
MSPEKIEKRYVGRELSWLSFNERVLQEADDKETPLIERLKFLGIYSNNRDEFFRVRVATLKRLISMGKDAENVVLGDPERMLEEVNREVVRQQKRFDAVYASLSKELEAEGIHMVNENNLSVAQAEFVSMYFQEQVRPTLVPIMLDLAPHFPYLRDKSLYFIIRLSSSKKKAKHTHCVIELPSDVLPRFVVLPEDSTGVHIIFLDDVIRHNLGSMFTHMPYDTFEAYTIKMTRDSELELSNDVSQSYLEKLERSLQKRKKGSPVRFVYDREMPNDMLRMVLKAVKFKGTSSLIAGARYHNFKDFMSFPEVGGKKLRQKRLKPLPHPDLPAGTSFIEVMRHKDVMLCYPYHSFNPVIDLIREAAIDPKVTHIKMTLYRVANNSLVVKSLINAVRNGKDVTVVVELQARFDEESNIYWSKKLQDEGARVIFGVPGLKVHAKLLLIARKEGSRTRNYVRIGTGNFNEQTSRIYSDHSLFTTDPRLGNEVERLFHFFEKNYEVGTYRHLLVSPFYMRKRWEKLIDTEIENARAGIDAYIIIKVNNLVDRGIIDKLYEASAAGVKVTLIVRGMCSLRPGVKGLSDNITAISIVGRYLEHSRILIFANGGDEKMYISSADLMARNLDLRSEVACPIYDVEIKEQVRQMIEEQLRDNVKARIVDSDLDNRFVQRKGVAIESHVTMHEYYRNLLENRA